MVPHEDESDEGLAISGRFLAFWSSLEERFDRPAGIVVYIVAALIVVFLIVDNVYSQLTESILPHTRRGELLLSILVILVCALIRQTQRQSTWLKFQRVALQRDLNGINTALAGSLTQSDRETAAYEELCRIVAARAVRRVDLLQLSGQTAFHLLHTIVEKRRQCKVRLLLLHPDIAKNYDKVGKFDYHIERIRTTLNQIKTFDTSGMIEVRLYKSEPSVCSVAFDRSLVCVGWYKRYYDGAVQKIRSHNIPMVIDRTERSTGLKRFAAAHFEEMWKAENTVEVGTVEGIVE